MKVLIVHDREEVAEEISRLIVKLIDERSISIIHDYQSARDKLREDFFDLMILDLTLPIEKGDPDPSLRNAQRLLESLLTDPRFRKPGDILGITNDKEALRLVDNSISRFLMATVPEDSDGTWRQTIVEKVEYVRDARRSREIVAWTTHDVDVGIVTALNKEAKPFAGMFELSNTFHRDVRSFNFRCKDGKLRRGVLLAIGKSGQAPAASMTQELISLFRPRLMIMTGFCGGRQERVDAGDLIAFTTSYAWDYGKWVQEKGETKDAVPKFEPRPTPLIVEEDGIDRVIRTVIDRGDPELAELERSVREMSAGKIDGWKVRRAAAGSGSAVVTSEAMLGRIKDIDEDIYAVDMESYGFYLACRQTRMARPDFVCIKSVADFCNGTKDSSLHPACCEISASFAKRLITEEYNFEDGER